MKEFSAPSFHLSIIFPWRLPRPKCTSHTPPVDTKRRDLARSIAQSPKDSWTCSWSVLTVKMVRSNRLSESSDKLSRSFTSSPVKTHLKSCSRLSHKEEPERTQPELDQEVPSEDKPLMSPQWEESTKLSTWCARDLESPLSDLTRACAKPLLMKSSTPPRVSVKATLSPSKRRTKSKESLRVTDEITCCWYVHKVCNVLV